MSVTTYGKCSVEEARASLANGRDCQMVDVREYSEYEAERVSGSVLAPLSALEDNLDSIARDRRVYLMCRSGKRAAQAAERLLSKGFTDVRVIDGGMQAWAAAGLPIEKGEGRVWALERQVRFVAGSLVLAGVLLSLVSPWFILLSGFVGAGLTFSAITDTCGMAMLLARMPWNRKPKTNDEGAASCAKA